MTYDPWHTRRAAELARWVIARDRGICWLKARRTHHRPHTHTPHTLVTTMTETPADPIEDAGRRKADRADELIARADMRIEVVKREINYVMGLGREGEDYSRIADYGATLVVAALDSFDASEAKR